MQVLRAISMRKGIAKLKVFFALLQDSPSLNDAALFFYNDISRWRLTIYSWG